jgi:hypothetical protein
VTRSAARAFGGRLRLSPSDSADRPTQVTIVERLTDMMSEAQVRLASCRLGAPAVPSFSGAGSARNPSRTLKKMRFLQHINATRPAWTAFSEQSAISTRKVLGSYSLIRSAINVQRHNFGVLAAAKQFEKVQYVMCPLTAFQGVFEFVASHVASIYTLD